MNYKGRKEKGKGTSYIHCEVSADTKELLINITDKLNAELNEKYYRWQVFEASLRYFEKQLKAMDLDQKLKLLNETTEV